MATSRTKRDKGSKQHILDLVGSESFRATMNGLLAGTDVRLATSPCYVPEGMGRKSENSLETYVTGYCSHILPPDSLKGWWVGYGNGTPRWDLLCRISVSGNPGLLIVEAKAHENEMSEQEKKTLSLKATDASKKNDTQIRRRITETCRVLNRLRVGRFRLSANNHYQLANRLAYLTKLASLNVPTVLLYLGFLKSPAWPKDHFCTDAHWQRVMGGYLQGAVPHGFPERKHGICKGSMQMLVRSLPTRGK